MSLNPNFVATMSTDEIYFGEDLLACMTEVVEGKADSNHEHDNSYAAISHVHTNYADKNHTHTNYAATNHTHTNYAVTSHTHTNYSTTTHTHTASAVGAVATSDIATVSEVKGYLSI